MNFFRRWLLLAAIVWGTPSLFLWFGTDALLNQKAEKWTQNRAKALESELSRFAERARVQDYFRERFTEIFRNLDKLPTTAAVERWKNERSGFPKGLVRGYLFDDRTNLIGASIRCSHQNVQWLARYIRKPWAEIRFEKQPLFPADDGWFQEFGQYCDHLRDQTGDVHQISRGPFSKGQPGWAFHQWVDFPRRGSFGGAIFFIFPEFLPEDFVIRECARTSMDPEVSLGFSINAVLKMAPSAIGEAAFKTLIEEFRARPQARFDFKNLLVCTRTYQGGATLFAVTSGRFREHRWLAPLSAMYFLGSIFFLSWLYHNVSHGVPLRLPLAAKFIGLFSLGTVFPLIVSGFMANLYLGEKEADLRQTARQKALAELEKIDRGYSTELERRKLVYNNLFGFYGSQPVPYATLAANLEKLFRCGNLDEYFVVSSSWRILQARWQMQRAEFMIAMNLKYFEKVALVREWCSRGWAPSWSLVAKILLKPDPRTLEGIGLVSGMTSQNAGLCEVLARVNMNQADLTAGVALTEPKPDSRALAVVAMVDDPVFPIIKGAKASMGTFLFTGIKEESACYYSNIIKNPKGRSEYFVFLRHTNFNLEKPYLDYVFSSLKLRDGVSLAAIPLGNELLPYYPRSGAAEPFASIVSRMRTFREPTLSQETIVDGTPADVIARKGTVLSDYLFFKVVPLSRIQRKLNVYSLRALVFVFGSTALGLLSTVMLWRRFLLPVRDLNNALEAMRSHNHDFRVPDYPQDELGILCMAFNRAFASLKDLEVASAIQSRLLPDRPRSVFPYIVEGKNIMTEAVGGDYFDIIPLAEGRVGVVLGDVAGHGVSAALVTAMAKGAFTMLFPHYLENLVGMLEVVNQQFLGVLRKTKMMTCLVGVLDPKKNTISLANAGQCYPAYIPANGLPELIEMPGNPLGITGKARFSAHCLDLGSGSLVFYSDGLVEVPNEAREPLGFERFLNLLKDVCHQKGAKLGAIFDRVREFTGPKPWPDDATVLLISADTTHRQ